jgi:hypothetical protein
MDLRGAMAEAIGYLDGRAGEKADTILIRSEYRKNYMRGFVRGRSLLTREEGLVSEERTAEYVVAPFTSAQAEFIGEETQQMIREAAATMTPEDLVEQFRVACDVLDGLVVGAEAINWATLTALSDARARAEEALARAEGLLVE